MENPYQSPASPSQCAPASAGRRIVRCYHIFAIVGYVALLCVSIFLANWSPNAPLVSLDYVYLFVRAELIGVLLALAAIPAFLIRAGYLLVVGRFRDAIIDALFAGAAFIAMYAALNINPISG
jgi:hypothetical protein